MSRIIAAFTLSLILFCANLMGPARAAAQIDMGMVNIIQNGVPVGMIWVPEALDACQYSEYWYLGPDYVYPNSSGVGQSLDTILRPVGDAPGFHDAKDFFAFARQQMPGGKRAIVPAFELENCGPDGSAW